MTRSPCNGVRRSHLSIWLVVLVGLAAALASALLVGGARSASQPQGLIAFARDDGIYVMRPDGSGVRALWRGGSTGLSWSPDGTKLAFGAAGATMVVNADGTGRVRVSKLAALSTTWSPDGRVAFTPSHGKPAGIWVVNADGSGLRRLVRTPGLLGKNIDWNPLGGWLAFESGGYFPQLYVMRTNGQNLRTLTSDRAKWPGWSAEPAWSPDGDRIAFVNSGGKGMAGCEIWVMNVSGKGVLRLTNNKLHDSSPSWSSNGQQIVFARNDERKPYSSEIYVMNADGSGVTRLTHNRLEERSPAWQPLAAP